MLKKTKLSSAIVSLMATTMFSVQHVYAEDAAEEVVVTGIRGALEKAMDIKREAVGVVDAISAEDMGKFPDTNLAESLQRITGVSIDRANGEGSKITVRGFGGDNNMITLNGRMMPAAGVYGGGSGAGGTVGGATRAFDFANLASESVAGIEVYKTGRASIATGGIGATVNIKTAKPLDNDGLKFSVGGKALMDSTNRTGDDITPELSGLASWSNQDIGLGVGLSLSHQERDSGKSDITVNDWNIGRWSTETAVTNNKGLYSFHVQSKFLADGVTPNPDAGKVDATIKNAPKEGQLYARPNDLRYAFSDTERTRDNAQLTFQYAPTDAIKMTADYTYANNDIKERRGETTSWLANGSSITEVEFDNSRGVAAPLLIKEVAGPRDQGYEQQLRQQENTLNSLGFNLDWAVTDNLNLNFDAHSSEMESLPSGPGNSGEIAVSMGTPSQMSHWLNFRGYTPTFNFTNDDRQVRDAKSNPISYSGNNNGVYDAGDMGSQVVRVFYADQINQIDEIRLDGVLKFDEGHFDFGVQARAMENKNKSSQNYMAMGDWGIATVGDIPTSLIEPFNLAGFDSLDTGDSFQGGFKGKAELIGQALVDYYKAKDPAKKGNYALKASTDYAANSKVEEDTQAAYFQLALESELAGMKTNFMAGLRFESTDVTATSFVIPPLYLVWQDDNDFQAEYPKGSVAAPQVDASYDNLLPSLDFDIAFSDSLKGRFSFSQTIARAGYGSLSNAVTNYGSGGGSTALGKTRSANVGNPSLLPLQSTNADISLEWYYDDSSYVSGGLFEKRVANFIGNEKTTRQLYGIKDQTAAKSPRVIAALQALKNSGVSQDDRSLFVMMAILDNPTAFPTGAAAYPNSGNSSADDIAKTKIATDYDIVPRADDPVSDWQVNAPINNKEAKLYGAELAAQHFFGESGFGLQANYTIVRGDVGYKNDEDPSVSQFALVGLSDTMNIVGVYENFGVSARLAYNWRGSFLNNASKGNNRNPVYTEAYSQWDLSVGYNITDDLSVSFEGLNLTGEDRRDHGRTWNMVEYMEDLGPRYAVGARYNF